MMKFKLWRLAFFSSTFVLFACGGGDSLIPIQATNGYPVFTAKEYSGDRGRLDAEETKLAKVGLRFVMGMTPATDAKEETGAKPSDESLIRASQKAALKHFIGVSSGFVAKYDRSYYTYVNGERALVNWDGKNISGDKAKLTAARTRLAHLKAMDSER
jgi:hypothetical protein